MGRKSEERIVLFWFVFQELSSSGYFFFLFIIIIIIIIIIIFFLVFRFDSEAATLPATRLTLLSFPAYVKPERKGIVGRNDVEPARNTHTGPSQHVNISASVQQQVGKGRTYVLCLMVNCGPASAPAAASTSSSAAKTAGIRAQRPRRQRRHSPGRPRVDVVHAARGWDQGLQHEPDRWQCTQEPAAARP